MPKGSPGADARIEIAIVGGGISGIYCAWRLQAELASSVRVHLYEASSRFGGRLLSVKPPGLPGTVVELGGMRYASTHSRVQRLLSRFKLQGHPFPVHPLQNIAYLRGRRLRWHELDLPAALPYSFAADEASEAALREGFVVRAAKRVLRRMLSREVSLSEEDWRDAKVASYNACGPRYRLSDLPLRYLLQRNISAEALRFADDVSGYDSILTTWNGFDGLRWNTAEFGLKQEYFGIREGYAELPRRILDCYRKLGGAVDEQRRLTVIRPATGPRLELAFADGTIGEADRVILAMPRRAIELIDTSAVLPEGAGGATVPALLSSVTPIPLFKLALCYTFAWWETIDPVPLPPIGAAARLENGESVTDLPIRQCYYWAKDPTTGRAVILVYDDGRDLDYWSGLRDSAPRFSSASFADEAVDPEWEAHKAPEIMVREAHRQLLEIHGVVHRSDIPQPYAAAYKDWNSDPYGGGVNFWNLGADSELVARTMPRPDKTGPIHICGEAFSERHQGWVEGALDTADQVLSHFNLKPLDA